MAELSRKLTEIGGNQEHIELLVNDLRGDVVLWVGAGMSAALGYPTWSDFLRGQARQAGKESEVEEFLSKGEFEDAAQCLLDARSRRRFDDEIDLTFGEARIPAGEITGAVAQLPQLTRGLVVTTNFDRVLEHVFAEKLGTVPVRVMGSELQQATDVIQQSGRAILKIHGDIKESTDRIFTKLDYERAYGKSEGSRIPGSLRQLLRPIFTKRVLFLGASLHADRTARILEEVVGEIRNLVHYAIVERPPDADAAQARDGELSRLGIRPIWYPQGEHELLDNLLGYLVTRLEETSARDGGGAEPAIPGDDGDWLEVGPGGDGAQEIIQARLTALDGTLERPDDPEDWPDRLNLETPVVPQELWRYLAEQIVRKKEDRRDDLRRLAERLAEPAAGGTTEIEELWNDYERLQVGSQRLFRDFLEVLGGLAVRGKLGDDRLWRIADGLVKQCAELQWSGRSSVTIPAIKEALARTPAGIVRLRFPEWTIWNLPMIAHEYGHIVIDEDRTLCGFTEEAAEVRAGVQRMSDAASPRAVERAERRARRQLRVFIADVFSAFVLGPAYGYAALVLKLDPSAEADWDSPADAERAHVILAALRRLEPGDSSASYRKALSLLEERWQQLVSCVTASPALGEADAKELDDLVDRLLAEFRSRDSFLRPTAAYPHHAGRANSRWNPENGWRIAAGQARYWLSIAARDGDAATAPRRVASTLRDVLNAAWLSRIAAPERTSQLGQLAEEACEQLLAEPGAAATTTPSLTRTPVSPR